MKKRLSLSISFVLLFVICLLSFSAYAGDGVSDYKGTTTLNSLSKVDCDITVKWQRVNCDGYIIDYSTNHKFINSAQIKVEGGNVSSYVIEHRDRNAVYYVRVCPYIENNGVIDMGTYSIPRYTAKLTNLKASAASDTVTLTWSKVDNASGYQVVKYDTEKKQTSHLTFVSNSNLSYTVKGLKPNNTYSYYVRSYVIVNGDKWYGAYPDYVSAITKPADSVLTSLTQKDTDITVKWKSVDCTGYIISYSTNQNFKNCADINVKGGKTSSYVIKYRDRNAVYYVRIRPYTEINGKTYYGNYTVARYTQKLTGLKTSSEANAITLSWQKVNNASGYQIVKYDSKTSSYSHVAFVKNNATTSYRVTGLTSNSKYSFCVRAYKSINSKECHGEYPNVVSTKTRPATVKLVSVDKKDTNITVKWNKVDCNAYIIRYSTDPKFSYSAQIRVNNKNATSYVIKNRDRKATYYIQIRAVGEVAGKDYFGSFSSALSTYKDVILAEYSSNYVNNPNRTTNLKLASAKINGTVIYPGETFSFNRVVGERTAAKGYKPAPIFAGSGTQDGVGGGICQVASTMFNTALLSNVQIVERHQHSQRVGYVPLGRDAAIYWGSQDFKWKNNTAYPIKISVTVQDGVITCKFISDQAATKPSGVQLSVSQSGNLFTLKRIVNGNVNYTAKSRY